MNSIARPGLLSIAALLAAGVLSGALGGCAAYQKCGFSGCPGDAKITTEVQAAFRDHAELEPPNLITVQTLGGVVYLYGLVDTDYQRQIAESVARQVAGVSQVINSIGLAGNSR